MEGGNDLLQPFKRFQKFLAIVLSAILVISGIATAIGPVSSAQAANGQVVISQVYGGGGNNGAVYSNDFVELYNPSSSPVDLTGWKILYNSKGKTFTNEDKPQSTGLTGTIPANGYYLVQQAKGANDVKGLPTPDATE